MPTLREQIIHDLSRKKLDRLSRDLGIFNASDLSDEKLSAQFQRSRQFSNDTLLHFMVLADVRIVAKSFGIETTKVTRSALISLLLDYRVPSKTKPGAEVKAKVQPKKKPKTTEKKKKETKPKTQSKKTFEKKEAKPSQSKQGVDSNETKPAEIELLLPAVPLPVVVDLQKVPPSLVACKHLWLHQAGSHWLLSSKGGYTVSVFESESEALSWHEKFDEIRRYQHIPAKKVLPPGCRNIQPDGPVYPAGWSPGDTMPVAEVRDESEGSAKTTEQVNATDAPDTLYECPVCKGSIQLQNARTHLFGHNKRGEVKSELAELVYGLEYVADTVMASKRQKASDSDSTKQKVGLVRTKPKPAKKKSVKSKKKAKKAKKISTYSGASQDLWDRNRPWSGGGANGTGSRR